jgi:hypothetical protein
MNTVKVNVYNLLEKLESNLGKHKMEYDDMMLNYKLQSIAALQVSLNNFTTDIFEFAVTPRKPVEHIKDYQRAILMLQMSVEEIIELTEREFSELVMDEWQWKHEFEMTKTLYGL